MLFRMRKRASIRIRARHGLGLALLALPIIVVLSWALLGPLLQVVALLSCMIAVPFAVILFFLPLSTSTTPARPSSTPTAVAPVWSVPTDDSLPYVPRSLNEIYQLMNARQFEIFSAALVMCAAPEHRFLQHCGGSSDQGVDAKLLNHVGCLVAVQSKFYAQDHHVPHAELREFYGAIVLQKAVYGYFVTTSSYTPAALSGFLGKMKVHMIDGRRIEYLLKYKRYELGQALRDIALHQPSAAIWS
ncbi:restriction endonuclease [Dictyobacter formicarum]|uniref:Restriction endonuclease type IV Mrr domain-containing protein n=1 Tax=Dictyobacter formicarum TaxID=2778368 RepID=A0ABQ3VS85_9CHLR|nr:restriction endonuclease [Dictyobacter formicarum]GHO88248.1 hypothetical protein KSZ_62540 [Dictyobacter formicarum]